MKSYGVTIQMKPLQQYFLIVTIVLFIHNAVLTLKSLHETLWCIHSK